MGGGVLLADSPGFYMLRTSVGLVLVRPAYHPDMTVRGWLGAKNQ